MIESGTRRKVKKTVRPVRSLKLLLRTDGKIHGSAVYSVFSVVTDRDYLESLRLASLTAVAGFRLKRNLGTL